MKKIIIIISASSLVFIAVMFTGYGVWSAGSPDKTCAGCHEIANSVNDWAGSSHRNIACRECHGTALSEGIHSIKEKSSMLFHHIGKTNDSELGISEDQRLTVMQRCAACHQNEYAGWNSGGHAMTYADVFLNPAHNKSETIYDDCLRCHGMFYDKGTVADIVEPLNSEGPWKLKDPGLTNRPAIPCFACHMIHQSGIPETRQALESPASLHYSRTEQNFATFYYRRDQMYFPVSLLSDQKILKKSGPVKITIDITQRLCIQCHSPNAFSMNGTGDDRTPSGVHEGLGCLACHELHSNSAVASCKRCHPAISHCRLDVEKMNTSYSNKSSKNNIHFVACTDCHPGGRPARTGRP